MMQALILEMRVGDNQKQQWDCLWVYARLATMAGGYGIMEDAALAISGGRIAWLGPMSSLGAAPEALAKQVHDAKGAWLTPGLIDCHTHLVYAGNRANEFALRLEGKSYADIAREGGGILATVRATRQASEAELLAASEARLKHFLREGVTTIEIKSGYGLELEAERKMLRVARRLGEKYGVRVAATFLGAHSVPPEFSGDKEAYVAHICEGMLPAIAQEKLADSVDGFCESIAFSTAQMDRIFTTARQLGLSVKLHAEQLSDSGGTQLAARHHALSADHLEHVSPAGIAALAQAGTVAVLLPGAFYTLRDTQKPPVEQLRRAGVCIALASDCNPGTSPVTSLLLMLNMGCVLLGLSPEEALLGVTAHAAAALGLAQEIGTLEVGKAADIALWDIAHPVELSYRVGYNPCIGVIRQGQYHGNHS